MPQRRERCLKARGPNSRDHAHPADDGYFHEKTTPRTWLGTANWRFANTLVSVRSSHDRLRPRSRMPPSASATWVSSTGPIAGLRTIRATRRPRPTRG